MKYILIMLGIFLGDDMLKTHLDNKIMYGEDKDILGGKITVTKHHNRGAMLDFLQDRPEWVIRASFTILGVFLTYLSTLYGKENKELSKTATAMIAGGGFSNFCDRMKKGYVIDYFTINFGKLKNVIFNLSDVMIFLGALLLVIASMFENKRD